MDMHLPTLVEDPSAGESCDEAPGTTALACVLEYAPGAYAALPVHAGVELVERPGVVAVPGMPHFALGLMAWQGRQLPLIDLGRFMGQGGALAPAPASSSHVLVVAYQKASGQPLEYGALCAPFLVRMAQVTNGQQCALPSGEAAWTRIAISCFRHQDQVIPVADAARIFSTAPG